MELPRIVVAAVLAGLFLGLIAYNYSPGNGPDLDDGYCQDVEENIRANATFEGSIACHPPDAEEVRGINVSHDVEDRTDLACVCVNSFEDNREPNIFTINIAG